MLASNWAQHQSETSIWTSRGTSLLRVESQALPHSFLKTFTVINPDRTDYPWVSEDVPKYKLLRDKWYDNLS